MLYFARKKLPIPALMTKTLEKRKNNKAWSNFKKKNNSLSLMNREPKHKNFGTYQPIQILECGPNFITKETEVYVSNYFNLNPFRKFNQIKGIKGRKQEQKNNEIVLMTSQRF